MPPRTDIARYGRTAALHAGQTRTAPTRTAPAHRVLTARQARVDTIETDAALARRARAALKSAGHGPLVLDGDASLGHDTRAPTSA